MENISELSQLWMRVLGKIKPEVDSQIYDSFFKNSYIYQVSAGKMYVVVETNLAVTLISAKYIDLLNSIILEVTQTQYGIVLLTEADLNKQKLPNDKSEPVFFKDSKINPRYTFDNFVKGISNSEASQAALIVASNPGTMYNPLFIYSDSGLGKTHLLHAIANYIKTNSPRSSILICSTDSFVDEYIRSAKGEEDINELKNYIKKVDVLLIDDIQFLANKTKTEEFFFPIFNYFVNNNKQIVLTCDRLPSDLEGLEQRLVTRFTQGLLTHISKPEKTVCIEILKKKIVQNGLDIADFDDDALDFLADKFSSSVRDLEGALLKLLNYTINFKPTKHITLDITIESLAGLIDSNDASGEVSEKRIINIVAAYYNLTPTQIIGNSHIKQITNARHVCMYLARDLLDMPFSAIGKSFGNKDHSTVMSGVQKVEKLLKTDQATKDTINTLKAKITKKV